MYRLFRELAHRYDLHTPPGHYQHDYAFVMERVLEFAPEGCRLLDVGCGTGVFLEEALSAGIDGHGLDAAPEMVEIARQRLGADRVRVERMQDLSEDSVYDVVSCISWPIHYAATREELEDVVARCHRALRPGGLFVVQVANEEQMTGAVRVDREPGPGGEPDDTLFIHRFVSHRDAEHRVTAEYVYASQAYGELLMERHELRFASPGLIEKVLQRAGFREVSVINSASVSPFLVGKRRNSGSA